MIFGKKTEDFKMPTSYLIKGHSRSRHDLSEQPNIFREIKKIVPFPSYHIIGLAADGISHSVNWFLTYGHIYV